MEYIVDYIQDHLTLYIPLEVNLYSRYHLCNFTLFALKQIENYHAKFNKTTINLNNLDLITCSQFKKKYFVIK